MSSDDLHRPLAALSRRQFLKECAFAWTGLALVVGCGPQAPAQKPAEGAKPGDATKPADQKPTVAAAIADAPKKGGTLRVGLYLDAVTMDPHLSGSKIDRQIYYNVYEPLVDIDPKLQIKPVLAESWQTPDPTTLVLKLRQGVQFHDGTPFNAEAAKFNFDRMANPDTKSVRKGEVANIKSVDIVDPFTIKLSLSKPDAALLATLTDRAGMMISPEAVKKYGQDLARNPVGTGPFQFVEWVKDDHIALKRNESYWNNQAGPYLEQIRYRPILDDTVKLSSIQAGEIDVMDYVAPRDVAAVKSDKNLAYNEIPSLAAFWFQLNTTRPPFDKKPIRRAVAYALDVEAIVKGVWLGVGVPANGPISPASWAYDDSIKPIKRDVARAKEKLAEAGLADGFSFTLSINNIPLQVQEAEVMKAQLAEAGITMKVGLDDPSKHQADGNARNFDMTSYEWSGRPDPDGNTYQFFHTFQGSSLNWSGYSNPRVDELLEKTREVPDQGERKKLYSEIVKILQEDVPGVFLIHPVEPKAFSPKVQNYVAIPDGMMRFKDVWMK